MGLHKWSGFKCYLRTLEPKYNQHVQSTKQYLFIYTNTKIQLVNFVARFENLNDDFATVSRAIGLDSPQLAHARRSKRRWKYQKYYNKPTQALVRDIYAKDISLFNYSFDNH